MRRRVVADSGRRAGQGCRRPGLGGGLCAVRGARHDHRRGPDGLRLLRTDAVAQRPVDDRPRRPTGTRPVDLAGQRTQHPGRLADLGRPGGRSEPWVPTIWSTRSSIWPARPARWSPTAGPRRCSACGTPACGCCGWCCNIIDALLTPDLSENGPGAVVYRTTFWLAGALVLIMLMIQLGLAAIRRNGKSLAVVLLGLGQFLVVWAGWVGYGVAVVYACGGLTRALMRVAAERHQLVDLAAVGAVQRRRHHRRHRRHRARA